MTWLCPPRPSRLPASQLLPLKRKQKRLLCPDLMSSKEVQPKSCAWFSQLVDDLCLCNLSNSQAPRAADLKDAYFSDEEEADTTVRDEQKLAAGLRLAFHKA